MIVDNTEGLGRGEKPRAKRVFLLLVKQVGHSKFDWWCESS